MTKAPRFRPVVLTASFHLTRPLRYLNLERYRQSRLAIQSFVRGTDAANISEHGLMDWFEKLTGFREIDYDDTRAKLMVEGNRLRSLVNDKDYGIGELELVSLESLRQRMKAAGEL